MSEKASLHRGKTGSEMHNERDFDYERAEHIDPKKTSMNVYKTFCPGQGSELEWYEANYRKSLDAVNSRYLKNRQYRHIKSIEDVHENKQKRPTEEIVQYSKAGEIEIPKEVFDEIVGSYILKLQRWSAAHGNHFHILKYAILYDEGCPHCHIRSIWDYVDGEGNVSIGQEEGMKQAGLEVDNPYKLQKDLSDAEKHREKAESFVSAWNIIRDKDGNIVEKSPREYADKDAYDYEMKKYKSAQKGIKRFNNRAIRWTRFERELFEETLEEYGYAVDRERTADAKHQTKQEHLEKMAMLESQMERERKKYEELRKNEEALISERTQTIVASVYDKVRDEAKKDANKEKIEELIQIQSKVAKGKDELRKIEERKLSILAQIDGNKGLIEMIRNRDRIIARQEAMIRENERRMNEQVTIRGVVTNAPEERESRFDELNRMLPFEHCGQGLIKLRQFFLRDLVVYVFIYKKIYRQMWLFDDWMLKQVWRIASSRATSAAYSSLTA